MSDERIEGSNPEKSANRSAITRRAALKTALFAASAGIFGKTLAARRNIPIGVQLWCVRSQLAEDMAGTLKSLAEIGFQGVEFADYFGRTAAELRRMLDDNGLRCCGTHIYLEDMLGEKLEPTAEFNKTLGNPYLIVRWLGEERRNSPEAFRETTRLLTEISHRLKPYGLRVGYHNHPYIFESFDGKLLWNILADETPSEVILQLDTGNASESGVDVVELIRRNAGRTVTTHVKPYSEAHPEAFLGDDELDWPTILALYQTVGGTEWQIVEYEKEGTPPLEALRANYRNLLALLDEVG